MHTLIYAHFQGMFLSDPYSQLLVAIIKTSQPKIDHAAVATYMGDSKWSCTSGHRLGLTEIYIQLALSMQFNTKFVSFKNSPPTPIRTMITGQLLLLRSPHPSNTRRPLLSRMRETTAKRTAQNPR